MNIGVIIQARTSSTRLPNKVLMELPYGSGITVLEQVIRRVKKAKLIDNIVVATTQALADKKIVQIAKKEKVGFYCGSLNNVLERYYFAAKENNFDIIVRITSDCPCISPNIIDQVIKKHLDEKNDYTTNCLERSFIHGLDLEVFNFSSLEKSYNETNNQYHQEHVCPYIYENPHIFKINNLMASNYLFYPQIRATLDTHEDYTLMCFIYDYLYDKNIFFDEFEIIKLFNAKPWLFFVNANIIQKKKYETLQDEMTEAIKLLNLQEMKYAKEILESHLNDEK